MKNTDWIKEDVKVKIPKTKDGKADSWHDLFVEEIKNKNYTKDYLTISYYNTNQPTNVGLAFDNFDKILIVNSFSVDDLEPYKEEFPEKYCVKVNTKEEFDLVCDNLSKNKEKDFYKQSGNGFEGGSRFIINLNDNNGFSYESTYVEKFYEYQLITFYQFKEHMLKKSIQKSVLTNFPASDFITSILKVKYNTDKNTWDVIDTIKINNTKETMNQEIKVGDTVEVIDTGKIYTSYDKMFVKIGFKDFVINNINTSKIGKVFSIDKHLSVDKLLYSLNMEDGKQILIDAEGIKKIKETMKNNLLEEEFVIENCTLSQRLAIKAYCDDKKIHYYTSSFDERYDKYYSNLVFRNQKFEGCHRPEHKIVSFSQVIQALEEYQPKVEFKVGDFVRLKDNPNKAKGIVTKIKDNQGDITVYWGERAQYSSDPKHLFHLTPEEIAKWKEENEIKLPRINTYDGKDIDGLIIYGNNCAKFEYQFFLAFKSFVNLEFNRSNRNLKSIKLNTDVEITVKELSEIIKYIEYKEKSGKDI